MLEIPITPGNNWGICEKFKLQTSFCTRETLKKRVFESNRRWSHYELLSVVSFDPCVTQETKEQTKTMRTFMSHARGVIAESNVNNSDTLRELGDVMNRATYCIDQFNCFEVTKIESLGSFIVTMNSPNHLRYRTVMRLPMRQCL
jgi:hypothetical protein